MSKRSKTTRRSNGHPHRDAYKRATRTMARHSRRFEPEGGIPALDTDYDLLRNVVIEESKVAIVTDPIED